MEGRRLERGRACAWTATARRGSSPLAGELRPELHRYCARLMGSVIDGEDVVQDTLCPGLRGPGRSWARCRRCDPGCSGSPTTARWTCCAAARSAQPNRSRRRCEVADDGKPDPVEMLMRQEAVKTAVSRFTELPILQRSVVILKDVLDESLAEIAALLDLTVDAVKGHLARGRARLREINARRPARFPTRGRRPLRWSRYVTLFNQRDWDGLAGAACRRRETHPVLAPAARRRRGRRHVLHHLRQERRRVAHAGLARGPRGDRGVRRPRRSEAQLTSCGSNGEKAGSASFATIAMSAMSPTMRSSCSERDDLAVAGDTFGPTSYSAPRGPCPVPFPTRTRCGRQADATGRILRRQFPSGWGR